MLLRIIEVILLIFAVPLALFSIMGLLGAGDTPELIQGIIGTTVTVGLVFVGFILVKRSTKT